MRTRGLLWVLLAALVAAGPLSAADPVIKRGIDTFTTTANGRTFYDFAKNPIPAGFFCEGSAPFKERVALRGLPLEANGGNLHGADTVVERLDDAAFDGKHNAATRVQMRALSLVSISPVHTSCGSFHVYVSLAGPQKVTTMTIAKTQDGGGTFRAPLAVNARVTFVPVDADKASSRTRQLQTSFTFPAITQPWSLTAGQATKSVSPLVLDTDGDLVPDTKVAGTSNFFALWPPDFNPNKLINGTCRLCEVGSDPCHLYNGEQHCTGDIYACNGAQCP